MASLFTRQFYRFLAGHLEEGGVLVQWVQAYEINDALLNTMIAALIDEFPHVDAYRRRRRSPPVSAGSVTSPMR